MANIMYYAWVNHGIKPSEIYKMDKGELEVLNALCIIDIESRPKRG